MSLPAGSAQQLSWLPPADQLHGQVSEAQLYTAEKRLQSFLPISSSTHDLAFLIISYPQPFCDLSSYKQYLDAAELRGRERLLGNSLEGKKHQKLSLPPVS